MSTSINSTGKYRVRGKFGSIYELDIERIDGELGVYLRLLGEFIPVADFVGVTVLGKLAK